MDTIAFPYLYWVLGVLPAFGVFSLSYTRRNKATAKKKGHLTLIFFLAGRLSLRSLPLKLRK